MKEQYMACLYEHYHDNGDDKEPTIEPAVLCPNGTYITGFNNEEEAVERANELNEFFSNECSCGRGQREEQYDHYGIYAGKMCDQCFKEKYKQGPYEHDEPLDEED
ncbi:MAG: hypothetical protein ACO2ZP_04920 [Bacteriovoracaceae bacterium]